MRLDHLLSKENVVSVTKELQRYRKKDERESESERSSHPFELDNPETRLLEYSVRRDRKKP